MVGEPETHPIKKVIAFNNYDMFEAVRKMAQEAEAKTQLQRSCQAVGRARATEISDTKKCRKRWCSFTIVIFQVKLRESGPPSPFKKPGIPVLPLVPAPPPEPQAVRAHGRRPVPAQALASASARARPCRSRLPSCLHSEAKLTVDCVPRRRREHDAAAQHRAEPQRRVWCAAAPPWRAGEADSARRVRAAPARPRPAGEAERVCCCLLKQFRNEFSIPVHACCLLQGGDGGMRTSRPVYPQLRHASGTAGSCIRTPSSRSSFSSWACPWRSLFRGAAGDWRFAQDARAQDHLLGPPSWSPWAWL